MKAHELIVVSGILCILVLAWLGFLVHRSPRFPGSGLGAAFGITGAALMLVPLAYPIIKRIPVLRDRLAAHVSLPSVLAVHVFTGIVGPVFALIHTGHKFDSPLGMALTGSMLLVVVSGFAGRYLLRFANQEVADKLLLLQTARGDLDSAWGALERLPPEERRGLPKSPVLAAGLLSLGSTFELDGPIRRVTQTAQSVADLEFAIRTHELFKRWCRRWLTVHIAISVVFYALLALHIWAGIYFGLRWL
jgi:hypothetical protein